MLVTALCRFTSVLRTLAADRGLDTMLSQVALQGILFKYTNKSNIHHNANANMRATTAREQTRNSPHSVYTPTPETNAKCAVFFSCPRPDCGSYVTCLGFFTRNPALSAKKIKPFLNLVALAIAYAMVCFGNDQIVSLIIFARKFALKSALVCLRLIVRLCLSFIVTMRLNIFV